MNPTFTPWSKVRAKIVKRYGKWHITLRLDDWGWAPLPLAFSSLEDAWSFIDARTAQP